MRYKTKTSSRASTIFKINCYYQIKDTLRRNRGTRSYDNQACADQTFTEVDNAIAESRSLAMKAATATISTRYRRTNLNDHLSTHITTTMISKQEIKLDSRPLYSENRTNRHSGAAADQQSCDIQR